MTYALGLDNPKNQDNLGHVLRAASCYGASMVATTGSRIVDVCDTTNGHMRIPTLKTDDLFKVIPHGFVPVAVELTDSAESLISYEHPDNAFYMFGAEDATLGERILGRCRDVIYVPTRRCMNLSACVNVVCYDRMVKCGGICNE